MALAGGVVARRTQGTPQGGALSPPPSNIPLDDPDRALERRGHACRRHAVNGGRNMGQGGGVTMYQWLGGSLST